jgi:hypothetical protein
MVATPECGSETCPYFTREVSRTVRLGSHVVRIGIRHLQHVKRPLSCLNHRSSEPKRASPSARHWAVIPTCLLSADWLGCPFVFCTQQRRRCPRPRPKSSDSAPASPRSRCGRNSSPPGRLRPRPGVGTRWQQSRRSGRGFSSGFAGGGIVGTKRGRGFLLANLAVGRAWQDTWFRVFFEALSVSQRSNKYSFN